MTQFPKRWEGGRGYKKYYYTIRDLADLSGMGEAGVRVWFKRKKLDVSNLADVYIFLKKYIDQTIRENEEILNYMRRRV